MSAASHHYLEFYRTTVTPRISSLATSNTRSSRTPTTNSAVRWYHQQTESVVFTSAAYPSPDRWTSCLQNSGDAMMGWCDRGKRLGGNGTKFDTWYPPDTVPFKLRQRLQQAERLTMPWIRRPCRAKVRICIRMWTGIDSQYEVRGEGLQHRVSTRRW